MAAETRRGRARKVMADGYRALRAVHGKIPVVLSGRFRLGVLILEVMDLTAWRDLGHSGMIGISPGLLAHQGALESG